jgi:rare lipoprotein A
MRRVHGLRGAVALLGVLSLAACADRPTGSASGLPTSGIYKVGKPYQIRGVWYYPAEDYGYDETGIASWYGPGFHAKITANGEIYNENELTAAHRTLPMPSLVRVTNLDNGRSIVVRINDRGPYAHGRIIDLSRRGAQLLGYETAGTAKVRVEILAEESRAIAAARQGTPAPILAESLGPTPRAAPRPSVEVVGSPGGGPVGGKQPVAATPITATPVPPPSTVPGTMAEGRFVPADLVTNRPVKPNEQIYIQVGAFGNQENVNRVRAQLASLGQKVSVTRARMGNQPLQRVRVGPLNSVETADAVLDRILQAGLTEAKIIVD